MTPYLKEIITEIENNEYYDENVYDGYEEPDSSDLYEELDPYLDFQDDCYEDFE